MSNDNMQNIPCIDCKNRNNCLEYNYNYTSDNNYYEWCTKMDNCMKGLKIMDDPRRNN